MTLFEAGAISGLSSSPSAERPQPNRDAEAARQFEAVFLRQMLKSLERTARVSSSSSTSGGASMYGSVVVDVLADAIAAAGGIGLADLFQQELSARPAGSRSTSGAPGGVNR